MFTFYKQKSIATKESFKSSMHYLPCLTSVSDAEITIEKLDKVAKTLSDRIKNFAKLFGIVLSWCIFNAIIALFFNRTRSVSLDAYRMVTEGLRDIATQDFLFVLTLFFDNKVNCVISIAMIIVFGVAFFVRILNLGYDETVGTRSVVYNKSAQSKIPNAAYVVSYKQQVAFLA